MNDRITHDPHNDGIDRRGMLKCMAWVGAGVAFTLSGGVLTSRLLGSKIADADKADFTFVQISDSHIGFSKEPNKDVTGTLKHAVTRINELPKAPALLVHTGRPTDPAKPEEFDTCAEVLKEAKAGKTFFVPGEHDVFTDDGKRYLERYGKGVQGTGWQSFDYNGVHFIGLVNV